MMKIDVKDGDDAPFSFYRVQVKRAVLGKTRAVATISDLQLSPPLPVVMAQVVMVGVLNCQKCHHPNKGGGNKNEISL